MLERPVPRQNGPIEAPGVPACRVAVGDSRSPDSRCATKRVDTTRASLAIPQRKRSGCFAPGPRGVSAGPGSRACGSAATPRSPVSSPCERPIARKPQRGHGYAHRRRSSLLRTAGGLRPATDVVAVRATPPLGRLSRSGLPARQVGGLCLGQGIDGYAQGGELEAAAPRLTRRPSARRRRQRPSVSTNSSTCGRG